MTSIETSPLLNPTFVSQNQNQIIESKPPLPPIHALSISNMPRYIEPLQTEQIDVPGIADKEKYYTSFTWGLSNTSNSVVFSFELTIGNLLPFAPLGTTVQSFVNMKSFQLTIKNTNNFTFQGSLLSYHDPSPASNYFNNIVGQSKYLTHKWQFPDVHLIEPKNRNPLVWNIPINLPFDLFQINHPNVDASSYILTYSFGRIEVCVNDVLTTTSPVTTLNFRVHCKLNEYSTAGNAF